MDIDGKTFIGNRIEFPNTQWTALDSAQQKDSAKAELYEQYWMPLYVFLRRKGHSQPDAHDLVQGFLADILLGRDFLSKADRKRGRFRSLLLKSLQNYIIGLARKKRPQTLPKEDISEQDLCDTLPHDPGAAFDYTWATQLLDRVLVDLENECKRDGQEVHWCLFRDKILRPPFENTPSPSLQELNVTYNIGDDIRVSNMMITVKRRFRRIINRYLTTVSPCSDDPSQALDDFLAIFEKS
ncbi:RNA polymerase sigma factor [Planctomycetota bacterium]